MSGRQLRPVLLPAAIAVVVPARNEQQLVGGCLRSVLHAVRQAGLPSFVVVIDHQCTDDTAAVARALLAGRGAVIGDRSAQVDGARRAGARAALDHFADVDPGRLWLLSTDADTTVPADWVQRILRHAGQGAAAVAGLANLGSYQQLSGPGRRAYQELVEAGIHGSSHEHAYAANLAVRADAYLDAGGWPAVSPGEEHALLAALARRGWPVRRPTDLVVTTSGRVHARASGGLGDLLGRLAAAPPVVAALPVTRDGWDRAVPKALAASEDGRADR